MLAITAPYCFPEDQRGSQKPKRILKIGVHFFKSPCTSVTGMAQKEEIQSLINPTQSLEPNSPELNPSEDILEEIYGT